jgi:hypothetical protein
LLALSLSLASRLSRAPLLRRSRAPVFVALIISIVLLIVELILDLIVKKVVELTVPNEAIAALSTPKGRRSL